MGFRFYKSIRVGKGLRVNLSRSGVSASGGLGNTGLRWTTGKAGGRKRGAKAQAKQRGGCLSAIVLIALIWFVVWAIQQATRPAANPSAPAAARLVPLARPL